MTGRRGIRSKQLLDEFKAKRGYWKLNEEALDRTLWRINFRKRYGPVVRQTAECTKDSTNIEYENIINILTQYRIRN